MNSKQAKELALVDFIQTLGHEPTSRRGNDVWFRSPLRPDERTPSFKVDASRNIWYDHGLGAGGTIIDFAERYFSAPDISSTLASISDAVGGISTFPKRVAIRAEETPKERPVIESLGRIQDPSLTNYLVARAIPVELARLYLEEIVYQVEGRQYRALAFANQAGGFEVRNPGFKGSIGAKDITVMRSPGRRDAAVFEGAIDFLSTLVHYRLERPRANVVVLNSVALLDRAIANLQADNIEKLYAYLDHDRAGEDALARLVGGPWAVQDASSFYERFKDANEYLQDLERGRK
jgi:Toprim-like